VLRDGDGRPAASYALFPHPMHSEKEVGVEIVEMEEPFIIDRRWGLWYNQEEGRPVGFAVSSALREPQSAEGCRAPREASPEGDKEVDRGHCCLTRDQSEATKGQPKGARKDHLSSWPWG
jgi:hypothetical protein